jgi:aspartate/methionine/tyrosine aminotransferase
MEQILDRVAQNLYLASPTLAQHAALAAFGEDSLTEMDARREEFRRRRDVLSDGLLSLGFSLPICPQGAFYLYADASAFGRSGTELSDQLLEHAGVAVTPGSDFGRVDAERFLRFAFTTDLARLAQGQQRLAAYVSQL